MHSPVVVARPFLELAGQRWWPVRDLIIVNRCRMPDRPIRAENLVCAFDGKKRIRMR